jgi:hypothetical protein
MDMACPHRITCNANDIRNLLVLIESGGEVRGAMQAGLLLQVLGSDVQDARQLLLQGGKAMTRLARFGLIDTLRMGGETVYRVNSAGKAALHNGDWSDISVVDPGRGRSSKPSSVHVA